MIQTSQYQNLMLIWLNIKNYIVKESRHAIKNITILAIILSKKKDYQMVRLPGLNFSTDRQTDQHGRLTDEPNSRQKH